MVAVHFVSPRLRSSAVTRPYGGFSSGSPSMLGGICVPPRRYNRLLRSAFGLISCTTIGLVIDGTYNTPVSGSNDAPCQFAPPAHPGFWMVPFSDGGVNSGP